jgi:hypothetical protein
MADESEPRTKLESDAQIIKFLHGCTNLEVATLLLQRGDVILQAENERTSRIDAKGNMLMTAGSVAIAFAVTLAHGPVRSAAIAALMFSVAAAVLSQLVWSVKAWSIHDWMAPAASLDDACARTLQYVVSQADQLRDRRDSNLLRGRAARVSQIALCVGVALLVATVLSA